MGIKERQERDKETLRQAILDAARELFITEGYQHVSMRKIAERIEYSPAALYSYFPSKDDIFFALAEEGFRLLSGDPASYAALDSLPPLERIRAIFGRLYQYSVDHPEYFALMFVDRFVPRISREYERFTFIRELKAYLMKQVQECIDAGIFPPSTPPLAAMRLLTTSVVGVAVMRLSDRLSPGENAEDLAHDTIDLAIAGLQSGVAFRSRSFIEPCLLETSDTTTQDSRTDSANRPQEHS